MSLAHEKHPKSVSNFYCFFLIMDLIEKPKMINSDLQKYKRIPSVGTKLPVTLINQNIII